MPGLRGLPAEERKRLCEAFSEARHQWGPRARFAREVNVDASTVQALEGKRPPNVNVTDDMINRLTAGVGWPRDIWRLVASGQVASPGLVKPEGQQRGQSPLLSEASLAEVLGEVARRVAAPTDPSA